MMKKHIISTFALLTLCVASAAGQRAGDGQSVRVRDFELVKDGGQVSVDFTLEIGERAAASASTLTIIPTLENGELRRELTPVVVRGRRAQILYKRRGIASPRTMEENADAIFADNGQSLKYDVTIPYEGWMAGAAMLLNGVDEGCCSAKSTTLGVIAENLMPAGQEDMPQRGEMSTADRLAEIFPFVRPAGSDEEYSRDGITVYFHQGRHDIDENYRRNRQSLIDILSVVEEIRRSGDSEVDRIVIAGFASPEGSDELNMELSERRAETVRKFVFDNSDIRADRLSAYVGGEDWEGLRELVAASDIPDREAVIDIIDNYPVWSTGGGREEQLKSLRHGRVYQYLYRNFFPELREAAYITVYYNNK